MPKKMEEDLEKMIHLKEVEAGELLNASPDLEDSLIYIKGGLLKETRVRDGKLESLFFIRPGDFFKHSTDFLLEGASVVTEVEAIEKSYLFVLDRHYVPQLMRDYLGAFDEFFQEAVNTTVNRLLICTLMSLKDPAVRLRYLRKRFPGILRRAKVEDIATCLRISEDELRELLIRRWERA